MVIAIDGMDGVGKTTLAQNLAMKLNYPYLKEILVDKYYLPKDDYKKVIKEIKNSSNVYVPGIFYILKTMLEIQEGKNSILDRSIVSIYMFEKNNIGEERFASLMDLKVIPDLTFILYATKEERLKRIRNRNPNDPDLINEEALNDGYDLMFECVKKYDIPYFAIDTTNITAEEVQQMVEELIDGYEKCPDKHKKFYRDSINGYMYYKGKCLEKEPVLCLSQNMM